MRAPYTLNLCFVKGTEAEVLFEKFCSVMELSLAAQSPSESLSPYQIERSKGPRGMTLTEKAAQPAKKIFQVTSIASSADIIRFSLFEMFGQVYCRILVWGDNEGGMGARLHSFMDGLETMDGKMAETSGVHEVDSDASAQFFVEEVLWNMNRQKPVLFFSAPLAPQFSESLQLSQFAKELFGLAHVWTVKTPQLGKQISKRLGPLACYGGSVRLYAPRLFRGEDSSRHPWWSAEKLRGWAHSVPSFQDHVLSQLCLTASLFPEREEAEQDFLLSSRKSTMESPPQEMTELLLEEGRLLELEARRLHASLHKLQTIELFPAKSTALPSLKKTLEPAVSVTTGAPPPCEFPSDAELLSQVAAMTCAALRNCKSLTALPAFWQAANACTYKRPHEVFATIMALEQLQKTGSAESIEKAAQKLGLRWHATATGKKCERLWNEQLVPLNSYIQLGKGQSAGDTVRIYLSLYEGQEQTPRLLLGHIGAGL